MPVYICDTRNFRLFYKQYEPLHTLGVAKAFQVKLNAHNELS